MAAAAVPDSAATLPACLPRNPGLRVSHVRCSKHASPLCINNSITPSQAENVHATGQSQRRSEKAVTGRRMTGQRKPGHPTASTKMARRGYRRPNRSDNWRFVRRLTTVVNAEYSGTRIALSQQAYMRPKEDLFSTLSCPPFSIIFRSVFLIFYNRSTKNGDD